MQNNFLTNEKSNREHRLCYFSNIIGPQNAPQQTWPEWFSYIPGLVLGKTAEFLYEKISKDIPNGWRKGMDKVFDRTSQSQEIIHFVQQASEFFRANPTLWQKMNNQYPLKGADWKLQEMIQITDQKNWTSIFRKCGSQLFDPTINLRMALNAAGIFNNITPDEKIVLEFLANTTDVTDRRQIFVDYIQKYIPSSVLAKDNIQFSKHQTTDEKFAQINQAPSDVETYAKAIGGILGDNLSIDLLKQDAQKGNIKGIVLAKESIQDLYQLNTTNIITRRKLEDFKDAAQYLSSSGNKDPLTIPLLHDKLPASTLRGALELGLIDAPQVDQVTEKLRTLALDRTRVEGKTGYNLVALSNPEMIKETHNLQDAWNKLGGWGQLFVVSALVYGLVKSPKFRLFSVFAGLGVVGLKMAGFNVGKNTNDLYKSVVGYFPGYLTSKEPTEAERYKRARDFASFLSNYGPEIEMESTTLAILAEHPLLDVANSFKMKGSGIGSWEYRPTQDTLDRLTKMGWNQDAQKLLQRPPPALPNAIGFLFFTIAKNSDPSDPSVHEVELAAGKLPADLKLGAIINNLQGNTHYVNLVQKGMALVQQDPQLAKRLTGEYVVDSIRPGFQRSV